MRELFQINRLSFAYPEQRAPVLTELDLTIYEGEFFVLCGPSGCGKTTLLRQFKPAMTPHGRKTGEILFEGRPLEALSQREQAERIGFVQQSPENQIVTDKVWHELAFGLESLGVETPAIRRRVAEMASFFGIQTWFHKNVTELSGGQKQLLNLASVMAMQPSVLILDEPTSRLDPIAASDFLAVLGRINRELGTTVILTEHRLEDAFPLATRAAVLDGGKMLCTGTPPEVGAALKDAGHGMFLAMPATMRIWAASEKEGASCPVTVREGRDWLEDFSVRHTLLPLPEAQKHARSEKTAIRAEEVWFRYEKDQPDVVKGVSLEVERGEFLALLGGNGAGKSTCLRLLSGQRKPCRGTVELSGRIGVLPQEPQTLFVKKTVREDLLELLNEQPITEPERNARLSGAVSLCHLETLLDRHPYDLSGGEQQRAALAKILLLDPEILLLDEPTKGLDAEFKQAFAEILQALLHRGAAILMVSHDVEFCARYAHRCALFFDGNIVAGGTPREFFSGNRFYTTSANRIARSLIPDAVTAEDVIAVCGGELPPESPLPEEVSLLEPAANESPSVCSPLTWWRKLGATLSGAVVLALFLQFMGVADLTALVGQEGMGSLSGAQMKLYGVFLTALLIFAACVSRKSQRLDYLAQTAREKRKLSKRTVVAAMLILLLIPLTLFVGEAYLTGKKYYFIALLVLFECMIPFFLIFESRKPQARELAVIAVLCAIAIAGRAAFFMLPQFKPVLALTILAGVAFGGETGFLVGALTMLASNMLFSQGPWTPWQMFAMGVAGFLAGALYRKGLLLRNRGSLCVFGALAAIVVYGGIMNISSALLGANEISWKIILTYCVTGFPMDCVHAAATWLFLWFGAEPMLEKLDRIKVKYGLVE